MFLNVHGQLLIDELFFFNSKYTSSGNCTAFQYNLTDIRINPNIYNQLIFDCNSSSIIFRNTEQVLSSFCLEEENAFQNFRIHFHRLSQRLIQVNQLHSHSIELCSLDHFIQTTYSEYSDYRSQWAILVNLENENQKEQHHLAIATNGEMTFILFFISSESSAILNNNQIELIFPNENSFQFNRSSINVWRIDQGYVRIPKSLDQSIIYQLSKSKFTLFNNETFLLYGTQLFPPRRLAVYIDQTVVKCNHNHILQCRFPILPLQIRDSHRPLLRLLYYGRDIFNVTLTLMPRLRLNQASTNHSLLDIGTYEVNIDPNLCANNSLRSLFTVVIHLLTKNINGTTRYENPTKDHIGPIDCNTTAEIGREVENLIQPTPITDIISLNVDLTHQWYDHQDCRAERTSITFN